MPKKDDADPKYVEPKPVKILRDGKEEEVVQAVANMLVNKGLATLVE